MNRPPRVWTVALLCCLSTPLLAQEVKRLQSFEADADARSWEFKKKSAQPSDQHATDGKRSLKLAPDEYMVTFRPPRDWSGYDALEMDVFVEGDAPVGVTLLVGDADWQGKGKGSYWNRHNGSLNLKPGANTLSIPVNGLYRGEAGSRNNDLKYNIDPRNITRLDIGFKPKQVAGTNVTALYIDNLRLTKESRPDGIFAFDLGPASQQIFPGFTAVGPQSVFGKDGATFGLSAAVNDNSARDDTFPTRLYRDAIALDWMSFIVQVPAATRDPKNEYDCWVVYDDLGYWGGEAAIYKKRTIHANGVLALTDDRGDAGPTDYLYAFEDIEPKPGDNLWDLYVSKQFRPRTFAAKSDTDGKLALKFAADGPLSCRVAAIVVYPHSMTAQGKAWVEQVEKRNRAEFESRAALLGPVPQRLERPEGADKHLWVGYPELEEEVTPVGSPGKPDGKRERPAAKGQRVSFTFAVRPDDDGFVPVSPTVTDLKSESGARIPAAAIDVRYVHNATRRGFNDIAYTIGGESLRPIPADKLFLKKNETRQFWLTVAVPVDAAPGRYTGTVRLHREAWDGLPIAIDVQPFALDEPDFIMGYYGTHVPREIAKARGDDALRDLLRTLREAGMNSLSGGPSVRFTGYDAAGKPVLDFTAADTFMRLTREAGFTKPLLAYGGPGMIEGLHGSYVVGEQGRAWEKKFGMPFGQILAKVWAAHREHAKAANWLPVMYEMTDEPRVEQTAAAQVELMKLYREHAPWVDIGGSYSVEWHKTSPFDLAVQDIFKTLNWSALNVHTQDDLDMARKLGKGLHIYNQGRSRYSFGAYQFAEWRKGVQGRMQWHLLALHGCQFFDLDGREPDTAMINWGKAGVIPTIHLARCREGADDFRYAVTLYNLATKKADTPAGKAALEWLEGVNRAIGIGQNKRPAGFMEDEAFRITCIEYIRKLM